MDEEFYHLDIFGEKIDFTPEEPEDKKNLADKKGRNFNIFLLTDAFAKRNKKEAWILFRKALAAGLSAEEIFFKLFWQVKSMLVASKTKDVSETDMKPFPYMKAKSALKNFKSGELENLSANLVSGYHETYRNFGELEILVEKTLLSL